MTKIILIVMTGIILMLGFCGCCLALIYAISMLYDMIAESVTYYDKNKKEKIRR